MRSSRPEAGSALKEPSPADANAGASAEVVAARAHADAAIQGDPPAEPDRAGKRKAVFAGERPPVHLDGEVLRRRQIRCIHRHGHGHAFGILADAAGIAVDAVPVSYTHLRA